MLLDRRGARDVNFIVNRDVRSLFEIMWLQISLSATTNR
jgi:hypothetical protein